MVPGDHDSNRHCSVRAASNAAINAPWKATRAKMLKDATYQKAVAMLAKAAIFEDLTIIADVEV